MKKQLIFTALLSCFSFSAMAQAVLPTSWSFSTTSLPTGWTESGTAFYSASGNTPPAMKFDGTGDVLTINFASNPGNLTYYLAGNSFTGGTFLVEESDLGTVYTTLHTFTAPPAGTYTLFTDVPQATSRYIRFRYSNKVSGNIGLDDVNIAVGAATPEQEMNVKVGTTTIVNSGTHFFNSPVGTPTTLTFTVENLGTANALNIASATVSGLASADYNVTAFPSTVTAGSTGSITIDFTPSSAGNRDAILTVVNNDADENPYIINLYGVGGNLATEPTNQATGLAFSGVKTYRFTGTFNAALGSPDGYIVLRKKGSPITEIPVDGTVYKRGDLIGGAQVVYSDDVTSFSPKGIVANSTYHFAVFTYNGPNSYRNYLTTAPVIGNVSTPATMQPGGLYNGIDKTSPTFLEDLHSLINPHQTQFYSNYGQLMVKLFASRDTTDDRRVVTCVYSGENKIYSEPFDFTANGFSREHTFPFSWMPTNPDTDTPEYQDYHHLFPTNQDEANAVRSNYPLGEVVGTPTSTYLGAKYGFNAAGKIVYEPRDDHKGDAARAIMYESTCYTTVAGNSWEFPNPISGSIAYGQDQYLLKQWHFQDLPDDYEMSRNDFVDSLQGNRNPFVDSVDFACYINFYNMTYEPLACLAGIDGEIIAQFSAFPVPAKDELYLKLDKTIITGYQITDLSGRMVLSTNGLSSDFVKVNTAQLPSGSYIVIATTPLGNVQRTVVIE